MRGIPGAAAANSAIGRAVRFAGSRRRLAIAALVSCCALGSVAAVVAIHTPGWERSRFNPYRVPPRAPIADLKAADRAVALALRDLMGADLEHLVAHPGTRAAIRNFYRQRGFAPLWIADLTGTASAHAAAMHLQNAAVNGLDPGEYPTLPFRRAGDPKALARAELRLTYSILRYAIDARGGRIASMRGDDSIGHRANVQRSVDTLPRLASAEDIDGFLGSLQPPHHEFRALKAKLAELRAGTLRPEQVVDLRRGPPLTAPDDILIANMERWRWVPRDLGQEYVLVNIPDFALRVVREAESVFSSRVVVGRPSSRTPIMSAEINSITVNPVWNVPQSIVEREYLPALRADPSFAERLRLQVVERGDGSVHMFQPPGDVNALGRLRFNFPNRHLVYQHDTPEVALFDMPMRAYSHGCLRVEDAAGYALALLAIARPGDPFSRGRLHSMHGDEEREIEFVHSIPVHLTYQTAFVDESGRLVVRDDIYGHDFRLTRALRSGGQVIAFSGGRTQ